MDKRGKVSKPSAKELEECCYTSTDEDDSMYNPSYEEVIAPRPRRPPPSSPRRPAPPAAEEGGSYEEVPSASSSDDDEEKLEIQNSTQYFISVPEPNTKAQPQVAGQEGYDIFCPDDEDARSDEDDEVAARPPAPKEGNAYNCASYEEVAGETPADSNSYEDVAAIAKRAPSPSRSPKGTFILLSPKPAPTDKGKEEAKASPLRESKKGSSSINNKKKNKTGSLWNSNFQQLLNMEDTESKFHKLAFLAHDFQHAAEVYGKIIISERYLPYEEKTLKPEKDMGGLAGGEKFLCRGILLKYAIDSRLKNGTWMYGDNVPDDASAMKSAGHELRCCGRIVDSGEAFNEGVLVPLMTVVDYRGFRLTAVSMLPVHKNTICYGSADGGKSVHADYPEYNIRFERIFQRLNLKAHRVRTQVLSGPGDIEGHLGDDDKLYLLDFARLYPPESPLAIKDIFDTPHPRAIFCKMLRPELVQSNVNPQGRRIPLTSDAYTAWQAADPNAKENNAEVTTATYRILDELLPDLAEDLVAKCAKDADRYMDLRSGSEWRSLMPTSYIVTSSSSSISAKACGVDVETLNRRLMHILHGMHWRGINMRYLGEMRHRLMSRFGSNPSDRMYNSQLFVVVALLYTEMTARVAKNIIRAMLREKMKELKVPSSEPYRQLVLTLLNLFSGHSDRSLEFWTSNTAPPINEKAVRVDSSEKLQGGLEYYIHFAARSQEEERGEDLSESAMGGYSESLSSDLEGLLPMKCCVRAKYGANALTEKEWTSPGRLEPFLFQGLFFRRVCEMLNIMLADEPRIFETLNCDLPPPEPRPYEFMDPHLKDLGVKVKHMHLVSSFEGFALYRQALKLRERLSETKEPAQYLTLREKIFRLLSFAKEKLELATFSIPDSVETLIHLGKVEAWLAANTVADESGRSFIQDGFQAAVKYLGQACLLLKRKAQTETEYQLGVKQWLKAIGDLALVVCQWSVAASKDTGFRSKGERQIDLWERAISLYYFAMSFRDYRQELMQEWKREARAASQIGSGDGTAMGSKQSDGVSGLSEVRHVEEVGQLASMLIKYQCVRKRREIDYEDSFQRKQTDPKTLPASPPEELKKTVNSVELDKTVDMSSGPAVTSTTARLQGMSSAGMSPPSPSAKTKQLADLSQMRIRSFSQTEGSPAPLPVSPGAAGKLVNISSKSASSERRKTSVLDLSMDAIKSGYLMQFSEKSKKWKKKWIMMFQLPPVIKYFKKKSKDKEEGTVDLPGCSCDRVEASSGSHKWTFRVHHAVRSTVVFAAESEKEMQEWIEAIRQVIVFLATKYESSGRLPATGHLSEQNKRSSSILSISDLQMGQSLGRYANKHIALRTGQSKYLAYSPTDSKLVIDASFSINSMFLVEPRTSSTASDTVHLRHASGKYLAVSEDGVVSLVGIRTNLSKIEWEWSHTLEKNTVALRSLVTGKFLSSEKNLIRADRELARTNEKWQIEQLDNLVYLRSSLGAYMGARPSGKLNVLALAHSTPTSWFVDYQPDKKLTLRSYQGLYLARSPGASAEKEELTTREAPYIWQYEKVLDKKDNDCWIISTCEGEKKYLSATSKGGLWLTPTKPAIGSRAIFSESPLWTLCPPRSRDLHTLGQLEVQLEQWAGKDMSTFLNILLQKFMTSRASFLSGDALFMG